jgi:HSP20 family protein
MTVFRFEPVREVENLGKKMRQFMGEFPEGVSVEFGAFSPRINLAENETKVIIHAELPGIAKEDVKLSIQDNILTIKGEKKKEIDEDRVNFYRSERLYGIFSRSIEIPVDVDMEKISAKFDNGVLCIELTKTAKEIKEKTIEIL